eukprot:m.97931 g.97931  ORF g.97931 m.97931 type:complete len:58 (+) comp36967_c1_seq9:272-445(+)
MMNRPALASFLYLLNVFLDHLDGPLARSLGQCKQRFESVQFPVQHFVSKTDVQPCVL